MQKRKELELKINSTIKFNIIVSLIVFSLFFLYVVYSSSQDPIPVISPSSPLKTNNLNCSYTFFSDNVSNGNATIIWYNNSVEHFRVNFSVNNNTVVSYTLTRNQTNGFVKSENWTCGAITNNISINSNWTNASVVIGNTAPNNATPKLFSQPFTSNTVVRTNSSLNASSFVQDPDADNMTVEIVFWRNITVEYFRTNLTQQLNSTNASYTLIENATNKWFKGENITAAFRVTDNSSQSSDWTNASIVISNTQPENPNTTIRPLNPIRNNDLNCSFTYIDTNNDAGTSTVIWYNNSKEHYRTNISIANNSNNTIVSYTLLKNNTNVFNIGENWTCAAIVNDGVINSDWINSSVVISNSAPNNATPFIFGKPFGTNGVIRTNNSLNASSFIQDPDGDNMTVEIVFWRNITVEYFRTNLTQQLNSTNASYTLIENATNKWFKGENITAAFRVTDNSSSSSSDWVNASIIISNTQPENPNTTIRPLSPLVSNNLNCSFTYIDTNNDQGTATVIWYNNSKEHYRTNISIANNSNNTVVSYTLLANESNGFLSGQSWTCAAIVNDGVINSNWINATVAMNTPPEQPSQGESGGSSSSGSGQTSLNEVQLYPTNNIFKYQQIAPGVTKLELGVKTTTLISLDITTSVLLNKPEFTIKELDSPINNEQSLDHVYKYIDIETKNVLQSSLSSRLFNFKVPKSIIKNNEVSLYMYDKAWTELETVKVNEDENSIFYKSYSPHLSLFAVRVFTNQIIQNTSTVTKNTETRLVKTKNYSYFSSLKTIWSKSWPKISISFFSIVLIILILLLLIKLKIYKKIIKHFKKITIILLVLISSLFTFRNLRNPALQNEFTQKEIFGFSLLIIFIILIIIFILIHLLRAILKLFHKHKHKIRNKFI